ncbi:MAG TPA: peptidylprolyl isomerase, partial [Flavobacteriia bacterium]|nr:peptidylprolyl isomerase [Flavobacteriia bacterium]
EVSECAILEKILTDKLLAHHAVIDSLTIEEGTINAEVERKINYFEKQLGSQEKMLEFFGFNNLADMKKELANVEKEASLKRKMQAKITENVDVTPEEVSRYFNSLKKEGNLPEFGTEVVIGQIVVDAQNDKKEEEKIIKKLEDIKKEIENGASMRLKAILYSKDPAASKDNEGSGGLYHGVTMETPFIKEFKEKAFSLEEGEISEPFKSQFGYHIVRVEKIRGKQRDVRHILLQAEISDTMLEKTKDSLKQIKNDILTNKITWDDAVKKYSSDKDTNKNHGLLINPMTNNTHFELSRMDPALYSRISNLKKGEISEVFYDETREGKKMYKIIILRDKIETHKADLNKDYIKIKNLALQKKKQELINNWIKEKIDDTYIKIHNQYKDCDFEYNWLKK